MLLYEHTQSWQFFIQLKIDAMKIVNHISDRFISKVLKT
jgi:hypothetical protein